MAPLNAIALSSSAPCEKRNASRTRRTVRCDAGFRAPTLGSLAIAAYGAPPQRPFEHVGKSAAPHCSHLLSQLTRSACSLFHCELAAAAWFS